MESFWYLLLAPCCRPFSGSIFRAEKNKWWGHSGGHSGGPAEASLFLAVDLGEEIKAFNYGPSAARSVLYFLIVLSVAWVFTKVQAKLDAPKPGVP